MSLNLDGNRISSAPIDLLAAATNLTQFSVSYNSLTAIPADLFINNKKLNGLNISHNSITVIPADLCSSNDKLHTLDISHNSITAIPADLFINNGNLYTLDVSHNPIPEILPYTFASLGAVGVLDLSSLPLQKVHPNAFFGMGRVSPVSILLSGRGGALETGAFNTTRTASLVLSNSDLDGKDVASLLEGIARVNMLDVSNASLTTLNLTSFSALTILPALSLAYNRLTTLFLPKGTWPLVNLLGNTVLTSFSADDQFTLVEELVLSETSLSSDVRCSLLKSVGQLVAQNMLMASTDSASWDALAILRDCLNRTTSPRSLTLDARGLRDMRALAELFPRNGALDSSIAGERYPVDCDDCGALLSFPRLVLDNSHVLVTPALSFIPTTSEPNNASADYKLTPVMHLKVACAHGSEERDGRCHDKQAFLEQPAGVATVAGSTLVVASIPVLLALFLRRLRRRRAYDIAEAEVTATAAARAQQRQMWRIDEEDISLKEKIGAGGFGVVFRALWQSRKVVAVKMPPRGFDVPYDFVEALKNEAAVLMELRHPNVLGFYGMGELASLQQQHGGSAPPFLVLEFVSRGSLDKLLYPEYRLSPEVPNLPKLLAADVARGMAFIHSRGLLHRDLKSGNVLVSEDWVAKVADFGTLRRLEGFVNGLAGPQAAAAESGDEDEPLLGRAEDAGAWAGLTTGVGTIAYSAPEVLREEAYGQMADVWSFGCILWEIIRREEPNLTKHANVQQKEGVPPGEVRCRELKLLDANKLLTLDRPDDPQWAKEALKKCLCMEATERKTFAQLLLDLE